MPTEIRKTHSIAVPIWAGIVLLSFIVFLIGASIHSYSLLLMARSNQNVGIREEQTAHVNIFCGDRWESKTCLEKTIPLGETKSIKNIALTNIAPVEILHPEEDARPSKNECVEGAIDTREFIFSYSGFDFKTLV
jgi:hypothetical protein